MRQHQCHDNHRQRQIVKKNDITYGNVNGSCTSTSEWQFAYLDGHMKMYV